MAIILLRDSSNIEEFVITHTKAIPADSNFVEKAQTLSTKISAEGFNLTVGQVIQKAYPQRSIGSQQPHQNSAPLKNKNKLDN